MCPNFWVGYIRPEDASTTAPYRDDDLALHLARAAGACVADGTLDEFATNIASISGARTQEIAGVTVYGDETSMWLIMNDVFIMLASADPATIDSMKPFITEFLASQPS
jgi:hypothetical protein